MANLGADIAHALDPVAFAEDRLGFRPDPWQKRALRSTSSRLALNCSRQSGKSTSTAVKAVHQAVYHPGSLTLLIAPSLRQSRELFSKATTFMRALQPLEELEEDNRLSCTLVSGSRIVALPGDAKTIRGFSAPDLVIEDEAAWVTDELHAALRPMLAVSGGQMILMSTPFGRRGHFFNIWDGGGPVWERISVPATECPRISPGFLDAERAETTEWRFRQEYMCEFVETEDQIFGFDLVRRAFDDAVEPLFDTVALAHLTATSGALT
jgi:hypothetical protein